MAIIVLAVTGAIVGSYLGFKIYKILWRRKHQTTPYLTSSDKEESYKPIPPGWGSAAYLLGASDTNLPKRSFTAGSRSPSYGYADDLDLGSPITPSEGLLPSAHHHQYPSSASRQGLAAALNSVSQSASRPSLAAPDRKRFSSVPSISSSASISAMNNTSRSPRMSGAPHSPFSRIEIVPPQPLGPPPGSVVAADRSTLAFSTRSGISGGDGNASPGGADDDKLFDPDSIMKRDQDREQKQREFAQARAAYLSAQAPAPIQTGSAATPSGSSARGSGSYSGGPFRDSNEYDRASSSSYYHHRPASNEIRSMSPNDAATYFAAEQERRRPTSPEARSFHHQRQSNTLADLDQQHPASSPLEKLQFALQEQARAGHSSSSNEASNEPSFDSSSSGCVFFYPK